jgi:hypothetical protein
MKTGKKPSTLDEAHDVLWRQRPPRDAAPRVWAAFHRHSAKVYAQTAELDVRHRYEALQCAGIETHKAHGIEKSLGIDSEDA